MPGATCVVVAAHPDDETLALGGTLPALAALGWALHLVAVTDGEAAQPRAAHLSPTDLGAVRRGETAAALAVLGLEGITVTRLGLPDGAVSRHVHALVGHLRPLLEGAGLCLANAPGDGHPDHDAVGRAATQAAGDMALLTYPIWMWHQRRPGAGDVPWHRARRLPLDAEAVARKATAVAAHVSQVTVPAGADQAVLSPAFLAHFSRPAEVVLVPDGTPSHD